MVTDARARRERRRSGRRRDGLPAPRRSRQSLVCGRDRYRRSRLSRACERRRRRGHRVARARARCAGARLFARRRRSARGERIVTPGVVDAVADAARRWCDADFPPRVRATRALVGRTGYTEPVVDFALDALFSEIHAASLRAAIASELGTPDALETFVERAGRPAVRYVAVERVAIVSSESTIGVALPALVFALCAGSHIFVKDRSDGLIAAFARTLAEERPELASRIEVADLAASDPALLARLRA
ncbi:MAG: hypothetical protein IAI49_11675, partial [Candidatus Eremiobacteraeota bacterium]|nr:hypothetical protein [Candidatus Eremiobacteraeota bacterium]